MQYDATSRMVLLLTVMAAAFVGGLWALMALGEMALGEHAEGTIGLPWQPTPAAIALILLLSVTLSLPISLGLLRLYRHAVLNSMHAGHNPRTSEPAHPETSTPPNQPPQTVSDLSVVDHASTVTAGAPAKALYSGVLRAPWRAAAIYAAAGSCYALVMYAADLTAGNLDFQVLAFLDTFWIYAWPVVLTVNLVAAATWRAKLAIVSVYFLVLAALDTIEIARTTIDWGGEAYIWLFTNLPATVLLLTFLNRRVRAVGPLVLTFVILALIGSHLAQSIAGSGERMIRSITYLGSTLGLDTNGINIGLIVLGFAAFGPVGWLTLRSIRHRYERKQISDQSITVDALWLIFGIVQTISLALSGVAYIFFGLIAFAVYKVVSWVGFWLLSRGASPTRTSPKLLLLRVFSLGRRSERLFDTLATHWRHIGSIQLIAGPDLATTTIEPHEFLDFLSGKLARRFIDGPQTLDLRISEADLEPDQDGRFRVNDFFCHDDTWQMVFARLEGDSDAVLMDLRGFSQENRGAAYEINELINVVPLERVVLVIDNTTDETLLHQTVQQSWDRMRPTSPNRSSMPGQLRLFRFEGSRGGLRQLLHTLCDAASASSGACTATT